MIIGKGTDPHARRSEFLKDLALLMGFFSAAARLPDGRIPDVLRFTEDSRRLFVGDAKATETPGNIATQLRLLAYCHSIADYLRVIGDEAVFAVCCGRFRDVAGWTKGLLTLTREAGLCVMGVRHAAFAPRIQVISLRLVCATRMLPTNAALRLGRDYHGDAAGSVV